MYFKSIHKFDIDCSKLQSDFINAHNQCEFDWSKHEMPKWRRISITYSDLHDINDPLIWCCNTNWESNLVIPDESYKIENIVPFFKDTYTEAVVKLVHDWFLTKGLKTTRIKFANLMSKGRLSTHVDNGIVWRYHIPITTAPGVAMICNGIKYEVEELGMLYAMNVRVAHGAENSSDIDRILLTFDTIKIQKN